MIDHFDSLLSFNAVSSGSGQPPLSDRHMASSLLCSLCAEILASRRLSILLVAECPLTYRWLTMAALTKNVSILGYPSATTLCRWTANEADSFCKTLDDCSSRSMQERIALVREVAGGACSYKVLSFVMDPQTPRELCTNILQMFCREWNCIEQIETPTELGYLHAISMPRVASDLVIPGTAHLFFPWKMAVSRASSWAVPL